MADSGVDGSFVALALALRPRLTRCARLLHPDPEGPDSSRRPLAEQIADQALARTYAGENQTDLIVAAFRAVIAVDWGQIRIRPRSRARVELVDVAPARTGTLADDLAALELGARRALVLTLVGGLTLEQTAAVLDRSPAEIDQLVAEARAGLVSSDPARLEPAVLTRQLHRLAGPDPDPDPAAAEAAVHRGRQLARTGRRHRGLAAVSGALAVLVLLGLAVRVVAEEPRATSAPVPVSSPTVSATERRMHWCDTELFSCRTTISQRWRARTAAAVSDHLDPTGVYFSGLGIGSVISDNGDYWEGGDGSFGFVLYRPRDGATRVYVQISSNRRLAGRCGERINKDCVSVQFMNGSRFLLAGDSAETGGVEIQYAAETGQVISVAARDVGDGKTLQVDSADLLGVVQDPRLRMPRR